ncbi:uncharacterized protein AB675_2006 [Cyphellophora attinorum]|uniref:Centromere protein X n=1 Tax=Cyphellophora attinorum TaxID=1664694 RepID=A0A0N1P0H9_9EURO|nr:uncharacterized protein AB675_2006 [Phialophora attinorum]KPI42767.1 hypothetical protein AB675_2006 [Phialophora attinorum]
MATTKRARPSFSPPRPSKSKTATKAKASTTKDKTTEPKKRARPSTSSTTSATKSNATTAKPRKRQRSPSPHNSDSQPSSRENDEDEDLDDDDDNSNRSASPAATDTNDGSLNADLDDASMLLVEVIPSKKDESEQPSIPLPLIHRIAAEGFSEPETTKMSRDARRVLGKYIDTFVREAVARCAYEAEGRGDDGEVGRKGWVDVDELERVAGVLCLDF